MQGHTAGRSLKRLISLILLVGVAFQPQIAHAVEGEGIGAYPPNGDAFHFHLGPHERASSTVTIVNSTSEKQRLIIYPVDAISTREGGLAMRNQEEPRNDLGRWIHLAQSTLVIEPHGHRDLPFTIALPGDVSPGDHIGGIIIQPTVTTHTVRDKNVYLQVISRLAVRVYESIPGRKHSALAVATFHTDANRHLVFTVQLTNRGDTTVWPDGYIDLSAYGGSKSERLRLPSLMILPHRSASVSLLSHARRPLAWGYVARLQVRSPGKTSDASKQIIWLDPLRLLAIVLLLIVTTLALAKRREIVRFRRFLTNI